MTEEQIEAEEHFQSRQEWLKNDQNRIQYEGNFLLSKLDGYTYPGIGSYVWSLSYDLDHHNYHEDWNKLMRIIEKLESSKKVVQDPGDYGIGIEGNVCWIDRYAWEGKGPYDGVCADKEYPSKKEAVWGSLIELCRLINVKL